MSISHQPEHKRYRVYCSLGHKNSVQKYFGYGAQGNYLSKLAAAKLMEQSLIAEHRPVSKDHPFTLEEKFSCGTKRKSPIPIRGIFINMASVKKGRSIDWTITQRRALFNTYAPYFAIMRFDLNGKRELRATKCVRIDSRSSYKLACNTAIDEYLKIYPEYKAYKAELLDAMPSWTMFWAYVKPKAEKLYKEKL